MADSEWLRINGAVTITNVSRSVLYEEIRRGRLRVARIGRSVRIPRQELLRWMESHFGVSKEEDSLTTPASEA